jgi:hypothetical protein
LSRDGRHRLSRERTKLIFAEVRLSFVYLSYSSDMHTSSRSRQLYHHTALLNNFTKQLETIIHFRSYTTVKVAQLEASSVLYSFRGSRTADSGQKKRVDVHATDRIHALKLNLATFGEFSPKAKSSPFKVPSGAKHRFMGLIGHFRILRQALIASQSHSFFLAQQAEIKETIMRIHHPNISTYYSSQIQQEYAILSSLFFKPNQHKYNGAN